MLSLRASVTRRLLAQTCNFRKPHCVYNSHVLNDQFTSLLQKFPSWHLVCGMQQRPNSIWVEKIVQYFLSLTVMALLVSFSKEYGAMAPPPPKFASNSSFLQMIFRLKMRILVQAFQNPVSEKTALSKIVDRGQAKFDVSNLIYFYHTRRAILLFLYLNYILSDRCILV